MRQVGIGNLNPQDHAAALFHLTKNRMGRVTLTPGAAFTVVDVPGEVVTPLTKYTFDPLTANAAAELAAGTMYVLEANRALRQFTITHANNAQTDRTFFWEGSVSEAPGS